MSAPVREFGGVPVGYRSDTVPEQYQHLDSNEDGYVGLEDEAIANDPTRWEDLKGQMPERPSVLRALELPPPPKGIVGEFPGEIGYLSAHVIARFHANEYMRGLGRAMIHVAPGLDAALDGLDAAYRAIEEAHGEEEIARTAQVRLLTSATTTLVEWGIALKVGGGGGAALCTSTGIGAGWGTALCGLAGTVGTKLAINHYGREPAVEAIYSNIVTRLGPDAVSWLTE